MNLFFLSGILQISTAAPFSYQSGADGFSDDSFANSLHYELKNELIYITGATYSRFWDGISRTASRGRSLEKPDCFFGVLNVSQETESAKHDSDAANESDAQDVSKKDIELIHATRFGKEDSPEVCSNIASISSIGDKTTSLIILGHTEEGGLLTALRTAGSRKSIVYGFLLEVDIKVSKSKGKVKEVSSKVQGGRLLHDHRVQYPVALTSDPLASQTKEMHVALLTSPLDNSYQFDIPTLDTTVEETNNGSDFRIMLQMLKPKSGLISDYEKEIGIDLEEAGSRETLFGGWERSVSPQVIDDIPQLQLSGLVYVPQMYNGLKRDVLILTGTTNSHGPEFGGGTKLPLDSGHYGFITKFLPDNGQIDSFLASDDLSDANNYSATASVGALNSFDSIQGVCFQHGLESVDYIYVVGTTTSLLDNQWMDQNQLSKREDGKISKHAFLAKLRLSNLEQIWARQLGSETGENVAGCGCEVTSDGDIVYMAGNVKNGGTIRLLSNQIADAPQSAGGDDVFVASYAEGGRVNFVRQFGTSENDSFAKGNGIVSDEQGNAIVLGHTRGSLARVRNDKDEPKPHDIFIVSIEREEGRMRETAEKAPQDYSTSTNTSSGRIDGKPDTQLYGVEIIAIVVSSIILLLSILYASCSVRKSSEGNVNRVRDSDDKVMQYIDNFSDNKVQIHVRHSATGGVHGIYDFLKKGGKNVPNKEAVGFKPNQSHNKDPSTSNVLENALFIANNDEAVNNSKEGNAPSESYTEVVESYNASWKERSKLDGVGLKGMEHQGPKEKVNEDDDIWGDTEII